MAAHLGGVYVGARSRERRKATGDAARLATLSVSRLSSFRQEFVSLQLLQNLAPSRAGGGVAILCAREEITRPHKASEARARVSSPPGGTQVTHSLTCCVPRPRQWVKRREASTWAPRSQSDVGGSKLGGVKIFEYNFLTKFLVSPEEIYFSLPSSHPVLPRMPPGTRSSPHPKAICPPSLNNYNNN